MTYELGNNLTVVLLVASITAGFVLSKYAKRPRADVKAAQQTLDEIEAARTGIVTITAELREIRTQMHKDRCGL